MPDGSITVSGGVRVAWSNPARDGPGLCRQLLEQRECGRGEGSDETGAIVCDAERPAALCGAQLAALAGIAGRHRLSRVYAHSLCGEGRGAGMAAILHAGGQLHCAPRAAGGERMERAGNGGHRRATVLSQGYRAQIVERIDGGEMDVTKDILELKALMLAEAVSPVTENAEVNLLLVPLEEQEGTVLSPASRIEATETEPARYAAPLTGSSLFVMAGE